MEGPPSESKDFDTQTGVVPPDQPLIHVDTDILRVPAGTDYTVECSANGYPPPNVTWTDVDGNLVSEGTMLRVFDIRQSKDFLCVAENPGSRKETSFRIFVSGPGSAPEMSLSITKPKSILAKWDPPTLPNGNITRYIVYYTPLDDQAMDLLVGQVPAKPISEWISAHLLGQAATGPGKKQVLLTDFIEPDTAFAVVVQAENQDGPGPYSIQHNIRTMSRSRSSPPTHLSVEPINQTSVEVHWRLEIKTGEETPIGYEIYFIPAEKEIEEDEILSLPRWTRVNVLDSSKNSHMIWNMFEPDSEYVFKIRAFCIAKTLPDGDAPFLVVSAGGRGTEGLSLIQLLPGSDYTVFCRASGKPQPAVRWIRGGDIPIDPSTVKEDETGTKWSLSLENFTEPSTFNCVARNPLGVANWTIRLEMVQDLRPNWLAHLVRTELHNGQLLLHFPDSLPDSLRRPNQWTLRYSDDPTKEKILWSILESEDRPLTIIPIKSPADPMHPGLTYHLVIENPTEGVRSPVLKLLIPKAPSELRVGSNINDEMVVDFRQAITSSPIEKYLLKYWPADKEDAGAIVAPESIVRNISIPGDQPVIGIRVPDLPRDSEFYFQAVAILSDGNELASTPVIIRTPAKEIRCDCSHACRLLETDSVEVKIDCYCPVGWLLASDRRTCVQLEPTTGPALEISPTFELAPEQAVEGKVPFISQISPLPPLIEVTATSPLPTDEYGNFIIADLEDHIPPHILPTDAVGREIRPVVFFNGTKLHMNEDGNYLDPMSRIVARDEEQRALGPDGQLLKLDANGNYVYPLLDKYGEPIPTDDSLRPLFEVVDEDGIHWPRDNKGRVLGPNNRPIPTDITGQFLGPGSSPLPTNFYGQFLMSRKEELVVPTDALGYTIFQVVYPDGQPLPTLTSGQFIDPERGVEFLRDDKGMPLDARGNQLKQNEKGNFVFQPVINRYPDKYLPEKKTVDETSTISQDGTPLPTDSLGHYVVALSEDDILPAKTLPTDWTLGQKFETTKFTPISDQRGRVLDEFGKPLSTSSDGLLLGPDGSPLPTDAEGQFVLSWGEEREELPSEPTARISEIGPDGLPRPDDGRRQMPLAFPESKDYPSLESEMPCNLREAVLDILIAFNGELIQPYGEHLRRAMTELLNRFDLAADIARVGILHFGKSVIIPVSLGGYHEISQMLDQFDRMQSASSALGVPDVSTVYHAAIQQFSSFGRNKNIPKILLVFSSGEDIFSDTTARELIASHDIFLILVGPTSYDSEIAEESNEHLLVVRWELLDGNRLAEYLEAACTRKVLRLPKSRTKFVTGKETKEISTLPPLIFPQTVLGPDGQLRPTDSGGNYLDLEGYPLSLDELGRPIDSAGRLLPTDSQGHFLLHSTRPDQFLATRIPQSSPLPTDELGQVSKDLEHEVGRGEMALPTDQTGKFIHPVIDSNTGEPLLTDQFGRYLDINGELLPMDDFGRPLDPINGRLLPTNEFGQFVYTAPSPHRENDVKGRVTSIPEIGPYQSPISGKAKLPEEEFSTERIPVVDKFGKPLPTDEAGHYLDNNNEPLPLDSWSRPLDLDGLPLPTNRHGQFVYTPAGITQTISGSVSPSPIPTDQWGIPITHDEGESIIQLLPTDGTGKEIFPVISAQNGLLLPRNSEGRYLGARNEPIPIDDFGRPLDSHGRILPINEFGQFIYSKSDKEITPTLSYAEDLDQDGQKQPIWLSPNSGQRRRNGSSDGHCFIGNFIELLLILDTSANVKILDYRMMKESIKGFLLDHFDLRLNLGVRVGLLKYGDSVEVPIALGDYDSEAELLARLGETRRLKGEPNLPLALKEAAGEFQLSSAGDALRIVLVWKSGNSSDPNSILVQAAANTLRQQYGAKILVITAAGHYGSEDLALTGGEEELIFAFYGWREANPERLVNVADKICEFLVPSSIMPSWPSVRPKSTLPSKITSFPKDCRRIDYPLDFIIVLDAANFDRSQFSKILESLATLVDESFNLSPDVVRVGLIVYSDNVAVPVALGHYEDKIELLSKMGTSPLFSDPPAIALRGLEAAGQQFRLHSRPNAVRVLLMVTNGKHRGNAAPLGQELREKFLVQIYSVAIGASSEQLASLQRVIGGPKLAAERMIQLDSVDELSDSSKLAFLRRSLCSGIENEMTIQNGKLRDNKNKF
uniref:Protein-tyrosine-phosphatase n=1 Tax=Meloidogyne hapla TaxID=6305 RepID=A0A1I8AYI8_MELHA